MRRSSAATRLALAAALVSIPATMPLAGAAQAVSPSTRPTTPARRAMPDTAHGAAALRFVRALASGDAATAAALVSPSVPGDAMSGPRLTQLWAQVTAQLGALAEVRDGPTAAEGADHSVDLAARFARSEMTLRVVLDAGDRVTGFWLSAPRPPAYDAPSYVDTSAFAERPATIGDGPRALPATLTMPTGAGPHPVVVLVHGSGPNDRDETLGGNRPFRDIAFGLASRGIGTLRYDKRTFAHPTEHAANEWTPETETIADAVAALDVARHAAGADPRRVWLVGHSLGAALAPVITRRDGHVRGIVMLAGTPRKLAIVIGDQLRHLAATDGGGVPAEQRGALDAQLAALAAHELPPTATVLGAPASYFYALDELDVAAAAAELRVPVLVLQGGRDYQVTAADLELWRTALAANHDAVLTLYPDLNHLFMTGTGTATPQEYTSTVGHVAPAVIDAIADFVRRAR